MTSTSSGSVDANNTESVAAQNNVIFWQNMDEVQEMQAAEVTQDNAYEEQQQNLINQIMGNFETEMENLTDPAGGAESLTPINVAANPALAPNSTNTANKMINQIEGV